MQLRNIVATLAALAISSAIAGPIPSGDSSMLLLAREEQAKNTPSGDQLQQYQSAASQFASQHVNQAPSAQQIAQARQWWPNYNWNYPTWNYNLWYNYYYYSYYPQYNNYWYSYLNWYW